MIKKNELIEYYGKGVQAECARALGVSRSHICNWHDEIQWGSITHKLIVGYLVLNKKKVPDFLK